MFMQRKMSFDLNTNILQEKKQTKTNSGQPTRSSIKKNLVWLTLFAGFIFSIPASAQVNSVEFGKNRVQYKKFKWKYYQTKNFNVYFNQNGQELAKYVAQVAEKELPSIENESSNSLQRRANIILYNEYADMQQSNIGLGQDWQNTGGTKLVNNKMVLYFDANHAKMRIQIRQGIAQILVANDLFGEDIGEIAGNQTLLDLPKWLTDGYISYLAENWSTELDDQLKNEILSSDYKKFLQFAFAKPELAGPAFWYFIEERYKKENTHQLLYLAKVYKNLNRACQQVCKKKFKDVLKEFMDYFEERYYNDVNMRKQYPKGNLVETFDITKRIDYFRFNVNPVKKNNDYVVTQYRKGIVRVLYVHDFDEVKTLLKYGVRTYKNEINPNYPMAAWDDKGTKIAVLYTQEGKLKMFVYDVINSMKNFELDLTKKFDQIQDVKFMPGSKSLLLSAVKNGHTDIYIFNLEKETTLAITNDIYDDLDPSLVAFPSKTGIIFSSNRPNPAAKSADTVLPGYNRYNVFLVTNYGDKPELNQITQLTSLKFGNARFPTQYNQTHFTFASDENGIGNRYAGFFQTLNAGLDTLVLIGDNILRNPSQKEVDSTLRAQKKTDIDSIAVVSVSSDTAYTFPLTNYESSLVETRIAGDDRQVSEVTQQSNEKDLYKLKIDENILKRRNVSSRPTEYMRKLMAEDRIAKGESALQAPALADTSKKDDIFQNEFANEKRDTTALKDGDGIVVVRNDVLAKAKLYDYKPPKFYIENGGAGFNNNVLVTRYQKYTGGAGPIQLNSSTPLNALIRFGTSELMEDVKINGGFRLSTNLKDNEWLMNYQNFKRRFDWGATFYRNVQSVSFSDSSGQPTGFFGKTFSNLYQLNIAYPFDVTKKLQLTSGIRSDKVVVNPTLQSAASLEFPNDRTLYSVSTLEFVYDNSHNPTMNIWNGLRYKVYLDWNRQLSKIKAVEGPTTFVLGADVRYYYPIFRNFIWAGRAAADFSWGNQKMIYYLGGVDGWLMFGDNQKRDNAGNVLKDRYFNTNNPPATDQNYAFQSLAVNMRGFIQNVANGNNAVVINSEFRLPIFSTFFSKPVNNAFLRNFQVIQFIDLGTAWNGKYNGIKRPEVIYTDNRNPPATSIRIKAGGLGPFAGGYGFGARSMLLGYFLKFDAAWQMNGIFKGKPQLYVSMGLDF